MNLKKVAMVIMAGGLITFLFNGQSLISETVMIFGLSLLIIDSGYE